MFEVSLYKLSVITNNFDRDIKTTVSYDKLNSAVDAWNYGSALATIFGYNSCAIFDTKNKKHIEISYVDPNYKRPLQY